MELINVAARTTSMELMSGTHPLPPNYPNGAPLHKWNDLLLTISAKLHPPCFKRIAQSLAEVSKA
jgi:hypothetical protein